MRNKVVDVEGPVFAVQGPDRQAAGVVLPELYLAVRGGGHEQICVLRMQRRLHEEGITLANVVSFEPRCQHFPFVSFQNPGSVDLILCCHHFPDLTLEFGHQQTLSFEIDVEHASAAHIADNKEAQAVGAQSPARVDFHEGHEVCDNGLVANVNNVHVA